LGGVGVMVWVNAEVFGSNTKDVKRSCFIVLPLNDELSCLKQTANWI
jgi:hypothetical protein